MFTDTEYHFIIRVPVTHADTAWLLQFYVGENLDRELVSCKVSQTTSQ